MKVSRKELRKMINEAFRGYQYPSSDGSRFQGAGPSRVFNLKSADVRLLEQVIVESLQESLRLGHQLGTAVHTASFNIKQSNAIPVLNMSVSEFDDEYIKDATGVTSYADSEGNPRPYGQQGDENHANSIMTMTRDTEMALEKACDKAYYKVLDSAENVSNDMVDFVIQFMQMLKRDILDDVRNI